VPTTGHVYISRHVTFDETFFPFSKKLATHSSTYTRLYKLWTEEERFLQTPNTELINTSSSHQTKYVQNLPVEQAFTEHIDPISTTVSPNDQVPSTTQSISQQVNISGTTTVTATEPTIDQSVSNT